VVPGDLANKLKPGIRTSFRVKGTLDDYTIEGISLIPTGGGEFVIPLNAKMRKAIGKRKGEHLKVQLEADDRPLKINKTFLECLADDPAALKFFNSLPRGHRNYFSKWIESAKTDTTKEKRIARAVNALSRKWGYPEMIRYGKNEL
jgi:Bacteriocin-protection, YdeI or OmpD-Associated/Domain of unknown function (DUF1905)